MALKHPAVKIMLVAALLAAAPAWAQSTSSSRTSISKSDENFLSEMPTTDFPGGTSGGGTGNALLDKNNPYLEGLQDPFAAEDAKKKDANVKYIYKGESQTQLRRSIKDDRIEDGYVQGLMKQRGPR